MSQDAIVLTGLKETLKALGDFDKDAVKAFTKVINKELSSVKKEAQGFVEAKAPLSGWSTQPARNPRTRNGAGWPAWDQSIIKSGISTSKAEGKVRKDYTTSAGAIKNKSAPGVIYELAGRRTRGNGTFIKNLEGNVGTASRLIWKAVDNSRGKVEKNISDALEQAKRTLQQNLDKEKN
jgi:uncharacterized protein YfaP (DUF2135 family)